MTAYQHSELDLQGATSSSADSETPTNGSAIDATEHLATSELPQFELNGGLHPLAEPWAGRCTLQTIIPTIEPKRFANTLGAFHHDLLPSPTLTIQRNVVASRETRKHKVTWLCNDNLVLDSLEAAELEKQGRGSESTNGEFVRNLKVGDVVTVWAKARFPGWANFVEEVKIDVYWAV